MKGVRYLLNNINGDFEIKKCNNSIHSSKAHFHNEISVGLVEKGCSKTEVCGKTYEITANTFLIIPSSMTHKCSPYNYRQWNFRMLYINKNWINTVFNCDNFEVEFSYMKIDEEMVKSMVRLFVDFENGIINIENESKLLSYISLLIDIENKDYSKNMIMKFDSNKINLIRKYLDQNYLDNIMLSDLEKISGISKYCLIRKFEKDYGLPPHKYITNLRINHAKELLKSGSDFADIALESGFYDQSHFTKYFKEYTGVTPLKYKSCI